MHITWTSLLNMCIYRDVRKVGPFIYPRSGRGEGGSGVTSDTWHSTDLRAEWAPFSALPDI